MKKFVIFLAVIGILKITNADGVNEPINTKKLRTNALNSGIGSLVNSTISLEDYAKQCGEVIGAEMPSFSCDQATEIPIIPNDDTDDTDDTCKNPALLGSGRCVPNQRIGHITIPNKPEVQIAFICRTYDEDEVVGEKRFNDIAVVHHNKNTGATCWYQSYIDPNAYKDGKNVPSPTLGTNGIWKTPSGMQTDNCASCHRADPFIHTPFLGNTDRVPKNPRGKYWNYLLPEWDEKKEMVFHNTDNNCATCHRIVDGRCNLQFNRSAVGLDSHEHAWMPSRSVDQLTSNLNLSPDELTKAQDNFKEIQDCCSNGTGCNKVNYDRKIPSTIEITHITSSNNNHIKAKFSDIYDLSTPINWKVKNHNASDSTYIDLGTSMHNELLQTSMNCTSQFQLKRLTATATLYDGTTIEDTMIATCRKPNVSVSYADPINSGSVSETGKVLNNRESIKVGDTFETKVVRSYTGNNSMIPNLRGNTSLSVEDLILTNESILENLNIESIGQLVDTALRGFLSFPIYPVNNAIGIESAKLTLSIYRKEGSPFILNNLSLVHLNYGDTLDASDFNNNQQLLQGIHLVTNNMPSPENSTIVVDVTKSLETAWEERRSLGNRVQFRVQFSRSKEINQRSDYVQILSRYKEPNGSINFNTRRPYLEVTYKLDN